MKDDAISRQGVLKLLSTIPPEEAMTKAMLIQNVKYMSAAQPDEEKISDSLYEVYRLTCSQLGTGGVSVLKYYIAEIWREIYGEEGPGWMKKKVKDSQGLVKDLVNDCISRQAAIDALDEIRHALWEIDIPSPTMPEYIEHHEQIQSVWKLLDKKQKELYVLPSAQPETAERTAETAQNVSDRDLISRKAAIVAVCKSECESGFCGIPCPEVNALNALPSAQPERKRGKWIPHSEKCREYIGTVLVNVEYDYWLCDACGYRVEKGQPMYNFCPNCGADMREVSE